MMLSRKGNEAPKKKKRDQQVTRWGLEQKKGKENNTNHYCEIDEYLNVH